MARAFDAPAMDAWIGKILEYDWPGNLREFKHACTQAKLFGWETALTGIHPPARHSSEKMGMPSGPRQLRELEKQMILDALARQQKNTSAAARALGMPRSTLVNRMRSLGLSG